MLFFQPKGGRLICYVRHAPLRRTEVMAEDNNFSLRWLNLLERKVEVRLSEMDLAGILGRVQPVDLHAFECAN